MSEIISTTKTSFGGDSGGNSSVLYKKQLRGSKDYRRESKMVVRNSIKDF